MAHLVKLCDTYGIDSMSAAGVIGFAFEAALNGVIQAPAGVVLDFGSVAGAEYLLHAMVRGTMHSAACSAGVRRASEIRARPRRTAGRATASTSRGWKARPPRPRGTPGMGLAYMTADRGGCTSVAS